MAKKVMPEKDLTEDEFWEEWSQIKKKIEDRKPSEEEMQEILARLRKEYEEEPW